MIVCACGISNAAVSAATRSTHRLAAAVVADDDGERIVELNDVDALVVEGADATNGQLCAGEQQASATRRTAAHLSRRTVERRHAALVGAREAQESSALSSPRGSERRSLGLSGGRAERREGGNDVEGKQGCARALYASCASRAAAAAEPCCSRLRAPRSRAQTPQPGAPARRFAAPLGSYTAHTSSCNLGHCTRACAVLAQSGNRPHSPRDSPNTRHPPQTLASCSSAPRAAANRLGSTAQPANAQLQALEVSISPAGASWLWCVRHAFRGVRIAVTRRMRQIVSVRRRALTWLETAPSLRLVSRLAGRSKESHEAAV
jgi:hypothetical protein